MVGFETSDDAAVYLMGDQALLLSVDFFTPMVDDPYDFGRITAANALSDIYAMGGQPLTAMNLLAFPCSMDSDIVAEVLRGGADVCAEAGCVIVGGHTIDDAEPKYGMSIMGVADPDKVVRNIGARPGDLLVLTKRIGVGIMNTALKQGIETEESLTRVIEAMATLNKAASEAMVEVGVSAGTDVTGFGLIGHLHEMALGSGVSAELDLDSIPVIEAARQYAAMGVRPGRTADVLEAMEPFMEWGFLDNSWRDLLADPQTSGGLLLAVDPTKVDDLLGAMERRGEEACVVGRITEVRPGLVTIVG